jgi:hypothetical protein
MRPEMRGGVTVALYAADYFRGPDDADVFMVRVPRGSWLPGEVMDKPHRIRWAFRDGVDDVFAGELLVHLRMRASHAGHRRNAIRRVYRWPLPRRIRAALEDRPLRAHVPAEWWARFAVSREKATENYLLAVINAVDPSH